MIFTNVTCFYKWSEVYYSNTPTPENAVLGADHPLTRPLQIIFKFILKIHLIKK